MRYTREMMIDELDLVGFCEGRTETQIKDFTKRLREVVKKLMQDFEKEINSESKDGQPNT